MSDFLVDERRLEKFERHISDALEGIGECLRRLVALEEKSHFHQQGLSDLRAEVRQVDDRMRLIELQMAKVPNLEQNVSILFERQRAQEQKLQEIALAHTSQAAKSGVGGRIMMLLAGSALPLLLGLVIVGIQKGGGQ